MFTGIIESLGKIENITKEESNIHFTLSCDFVNELKIDQSVAHNGCCLTVTNIENQQYTVTAIAETLKKTNLKHWNIGTFVNLERCLKVDSRLDGHYVQGHVDETADVVDIQNENGSYLITFRYHSKGDFITVPQGSVSVNGISLTVASSMENEFSVAIIPYTWEHTNMKYLQIGDLVNLEFDIIGKYVSKLLNKMNGIL